MLVHSPKWLYFPDQIPHWKEMKQKFLRIWPQFGAIFHWVASIIYFAKIIRNFNLERIFPFFFFFCIYRFNEYSSFVRECSQVSSSSLFNISNHPGIQRVRFTIMNFRYCWDDDLSFLLKKKWNKNKFELLNRSMTTRWVQLMIANLISSSQLNGKCHSDYHN